MNHEDPRRVAVVGAANVGATFAYALLLSGLVSEIVLIDSNKGKAEGEAMDLNHAVPFTHPTRVWAGELRDCAGALVTVIAAGAGQTKGESRLDLTKRNDALFRELIPEVARCNPGGILLIATNPVDVLTYMAWKYSALDAHRVIGSGTILDTARFRYLLSEHFSVDPRSVHALILGEHGDSEVPAWSLANIAGTRLSDYCSANDVPKDDAALEEVFLRTRDAAYRIIERKGATQYAVAAGLVRIIEAIVRHQDTVLVVSTVLEGAYGLSSVALSLPAVLGRRGVERVLRLTLDPHEVAALHRSASILKASIAELEQ